MPWNAQILVVDNSSHISTPFLVLPLIGTKAENVSGYLETTLYPPIAPLLCPLNDTRLGSAL